MSLRGVRQRRALRDARQRGLLVLATLVIGGCLLAQPVYASTTSAADRAATHTFLQATYTFDLALIHNSAKTSAAVKQIGAAIAAECPKALAHAPGGLPPLPSAGGGKPLSPHARGEADRHQHQYQDLTGELDSALQSAAFQADGHAIAVFAATVTPLRWSNPAIAPAVQAEIQLVHVVFEPGPAPAVCADMRSWVGSGYKTLSAGTKAYESRQESLYASYAPPLKHSSEELLKPYEGPAERAILKRREALPSTEILELGGPATTKLHQQLGIEEAPTPSHVTMSKVLGGGRTHTGISYKVEVNKGYGPSCRHIISISEEISRSEGVTFNSSSSSSLRCLSGKRPAARPQVTCDEGVLQIESTTLAQTRRVRLRLSSGHTIVSSVTLVTPKYGGPAGVFFQTLRGPSPYPVSLSELDAGGHVTRTVSLRAVSNCHINKVKPAFRQIVKGTTPNGDSFFIVGFAGNELGHHTFNLEAEGPAFPTGSGSTASLEPPSSAQAKYFPLQIAVGCEPHPFALVYGQLKASGATVLAATATTPLTPLTQVPIPAALHPPGALAYSLLGALPTELVVTSSSGATLEKVDLTARAKSETEYCEGYVEG